LSEIEIIYFSRGRLLTILLTIDYADLLKRVEREHHVDISTTIVRHQHFDDTNFAR